MPRKSAAELKEQRRQDREAAFLGDKREWTPPGFVEQTPAKALAAWYQKHADDKAPDGLTWGAHVARWRKKGAQDTHATAIIAACTMWTGDTSVSSVTLAALLDDYDPPVFGVVFTHPARVLDSNGLTPLLLLLQTMMRWMPSDKSGRSALWRERIKPGLLKVLKALKDEDPDLGSDFLYAAPGGITALHLAIGLEEACLGEECVESLLACGCDPDAPLDDSGDRPVHLASAHNPNALKPLLQGVQRIRRPGDQGEEDAPSKASANVRNQKGDSPLDIAVRGRFVSSVQLLLEGGADPNVVDSDGDTPLAKAEFDQMQHGDGTISRLLRDFGALALLPEDAVDEDHWTAHWEKCSTRASDRGLFFEEDAFVEAFPDDVEPTRRRNTVR